MSVLPAASLCLPPGSALALGRGRSSTGTQAELWRRAAAWLRAAGGPQHGSCLSLCHQHAGSQAWGMNPCPPRSDASPNPNSSACHYGASPAPAPNLGRASNSATGTSDRAHHLPPRPCSQLRWGQRAPIGDSVLPLGTAQTATAQQTHLLQETVWEPLAVGKSLCAPSSSQQPLCRSAPTLSFASQLTRRQ